MFQVLNLVELFFHGGDKDVFFVGGRVFRGI